MNYKWHTRLSLLVVTAIAACLVVNKAYPVGSVAGFWLFGFFHTVFASPDIDQPNSLPSRHMGIIGTAISKKFKHRGILHNPFFWTTFYAVVGIYIYKKYDYEAWWLTGGLIAIYVHIILDRVSTKIKRTKTKVKRRLHI